MQKARSIFLSVVDNNENANLIFRQGSIQRPLLHVTIPALGFDEEEVRVEYQLTEEWTFSVGGRSASLGERSHTSVETEELKFRYVLPTPNGQFKRKA